MKFRRRKGKAMATQTEDQNVDQLAPVVVSLPDPDIEKEHPEECDERWPEVLIADDGGETGTAGDPTADLLNTDLNALHEDDPTAPNYEADVPNELKAEGKYAFGIVAPQDREDIRYDNYDPREFILVHHQVWTDVTATADEATGLAAGALQLAKELRAQKRGMRKVNKHWSETKRELKLLDRFHENVVKSHERTVADMEELWEQDRKRSEIFANRLARRLRKARAGRDKRERQLDQANMTLDAANQQIAAMERYIRHLESQVYPEA